MPGYPIELNLKGRAVLVVGLGPVGLRKVRGLIEAGAGVVGIDPGPVETPVGVSRLREHFAPRHLEGASLVFACATPEVNREVVRAARERGVWVNSASEPERGDFLLPAVGRSGRITVSVSTLGGLPAVSALARDLALGALGPEIEILAELIAELRPEAIALVSDPEARRRLLLGWASADGLDLVRHQGAEAVRALFRRELQTAAGDGSA